MSRVCENYSYLVWMLPVRLRDWPYLVLWTFCTSFHTCTFIEKTRPYGYQHVEKNCIRVRLHFKFVVYEKRGTTEKGSRHRTTTTTTKFVIITIKEKKKNSYKGNKRSHNIHTTPHTRPPLAVRAPRTVRSTLPLALRAHHNLRNAKLQMRELLLVVSLLLQLRLR